MEYCHYLVAVADTWLTEKTGTGKWGWLELRRRRVGEVLKELEKASNPVNRVLMGRLGSLSSPECRPECGLSDTVPADKVSVSKTGLLWD